MAYVYRFSSSPIPDDEAITHECRIGITDGTPRGHYPLVCSGAQAGNLTEAVPTECSDGEITVFDCVGDCSVDGQVTINEIVAGKNIALGRAPLDTCGAFDGNGDGEVRIDELVRAVKNALTDCGEAQ